MRLNFHKLFLKPIKVARKDHTIYIIVLFISALAAVITAILLFVALISNDLQLFILNFLGLLACISIVNINLQGRHALAISLVCLSIYPYVVCSVIWFGWQSGFQYYLIPLFAISFLYPDFKTKYLIMFGIILVSTFLLLHAFPSQIHNEYRSLNNFLHTFNAFNTFMTLAFVNYYFRTNLLGLIGRLDTTSKTDMLTDLMNRRSMNIELIRYCNIANRYQNSSSIMLIDIDNFKQINDGLGHAAGDSILKQFSNLLSLHIRETDLIARWGGDEFLLLTPFTNLKSATKLAESLREAIQANDFYFENKLQNLSITIGVSELLPQRTMEESLKIVDQLLYQGKSLGRDQVVTEQRLNELSTV